jgi:hypothetical protein
VTDFLGVDVVHVNREAYRLASQALTSGRWSIDADAGVLFGVRDDPIGAKSPEGYLLVKPTQRLRVMAHRVIWEALHGPIPDGFEVNHKNGLKSDNRIANLELVTHAANMEHARDTGLIPPSAFERKRIRGHSKPRAKAATECPEHGVAEWRIRTDRQGQGYCLSCKRSATAKWRAAKLAPCSAG